MNENEGWNLSGRATYAKGREPDLSRSRGKQTGSAKRADTTMQKC